MLHDLSLEEFIVNHHFLVDGKLSPKNLVYIWQNFELGSSENKSPIIAPLVWNKNEDIVVN